MNKSLETTIIIEIKGTLKSSNIKGHFMDRVDEIIDNVKSNNPIKISIEGELGDEIELIGEPILRIRTDKVKVETK